MKSRSDRREAILRIVSERVVRTQEELRRRLAARGISVDQATLSRDLRALGVVKVPGRDGEGAHYVPVPAAAPPGDDAVAVAARLAREVGYSGNLVVVKTAPGHAHGLGVAIDSLRWPEVLGTVAGDDTLIAVVREGVKARKVAERIQAIARLGRE